MASCQMMFHLLDVFFLVVEEQMLLVLIRLLYCYVIYTLQTNRVDSVKSNLYSSEGYL